MPTSTLPPPDTETSDVPAWHQPYRFSRAQYEQIVEAGVFAPTDRVELINGQIAPMSPQSSRHTTAVERCRRAVERVCPPDAHVRAQYPLALGTASEPEPDVAIVPGTIDDYEAHHPNKALLIVEVADSSLAYDQDTKRRLYASHNIPTYWIVNLPSACVEVYTDPRDGDYASKQTRQRNETLALPFATSSSTKTVMACSDILPK